MALLWNLWSISGNKTWSEFVYRIAHCEILAARRRLVSQVVSSAAGHSCPEINKQFFYLYMYSRCTLHAMSVMEAATMSGLYRTPKSSHYSVSCDSQWIKGNSRLCWGCGNLSLHSQVHNTGSHDPKPPMQPLDQRYMAKQL